MNKIKTSLKKSKIDENSCEYKLNTITFYENISYCDKCRFYHR